MGSLSKRGSKKSSKRMSVKRESSGIESQPLVPEDSKSAGGDGETPLVPAEIDQVLVTPSPPQFSIPTQPTTPRRRVKSDDTIPSVKTHSKRTTHYQKPVANPEWTLFLGIPRNALPPPPPMPTLTTGKIQNQRHTLLPTHLPLPMRNRTKSDSALLAGAASAESEGNVQPKTKTMQGDGGEDWTLSLPLAASSTRPSAGSKYFSSVSTQAVVVEECERGVDVGAETGLVITVEDVDRQQMQQQQEDEKRDDNDNEEDEDQDSDSLVFRVPRIVRSCSSSPPPSTSVNNVHGRRKKSNMKWMGASSAPDLLLQSVERFSSSTLEEEVIRMLWGDDDDDYSNNESCYDSESSKKSVEDLMMKKMATLDEDLARFNALLRNGNGDGSRLTSKMIEVMKMRTVTVHSHPTAPPTTTTRPLKKSKSIVGSSQTLKPVLKHAKSCEPYLESFHSSGGHSFPPPPPSSPPPPVLRFPPSSTTTTTTTTTTARGDLSFFDELALPRRGSSLSSPSPRTAWSSTCSISASTSTQTLLLPFAHTKYATPPSSPLGLKGGGGGGKRVSSSVRAVSLRSTAPVEPMNLGMLFFFFWFENWLCLSFFFFFSCLIGF